MKKHFLAISILFLVSPSMVFAQNKIERFCRVSINSKKVKISLGDNKDLFSLKDTTATKKLIDVNKLTTEVDVLNYMSNLGWKLLSIHASGLYTSEEYLFFKKDFDSNELGDSVSK